MKAQYIRFMDVLHRFCMIICGFCLVLITIIIPWGVFTRYVLNSASSWPEPTAVLAMIWFSFLAAALCYRERLHIGVAVIPMMLKGNARTAIGWMIEACMMGVNVFMLWFGIKLVNATWHQWVADFPDLISVGFSYLPVPIGGAITALFVIERMMSAEFFVEPSTEEISTVSTE
jgi:TRAP-type C4-dicarboxylate transport system permease small subunit